MEVRHYKNTHMLIGLLCGLLTALFIYTPAAIPLHGFEISAVVFGVIVGLIIVKRSNVTRNIFFRVWGITSITYFLTLMVAEIVKYQPWHKLPLDGHFVNLFTIRSVYNSQLILLLIIVSLIGAFLPLLFSRHLWKHFKRFGETRHTS